MKFPFLPSVRPEARKAAGACAMEIALFLLLFLAAALLQFLPISVGMLLISWTGSRLPASLPMLLGTAVMSVVFLLFSMAARGRSAHDLGLNRAYAPAHAATGAALGLLLCAAVTGLVFAFGQSTLTFSPFKPWLLPLFFLAYWIQASSEELIFRGYLFGTLRRHAPLPVAVLLSSLLFAASHLFNPGLTPIAFLNIALFGALMAICTQKCGSIWFSCGVHALWNFTEGNLLGASVSGAAPDATLLFTAPEPDAPPLFSGGAFGPEGSLLATALFLLLILGTKWWKKR